MKSIMYHYVRPDSAKLPFFRHLHVEDFRRQLEYLANEFDMIDRETFLRSIESGNVPPNACVLTFDDGFKDHFRFVLPEFQARGLWGLFYVPTGMYQSGELLNVHRIHLLIGGRGGKAIADELENLIDDGMLSDEHRDEFRNQTYRTQSNDEDTLYVKRCLNYFIGYEHRKQVLDELMEAFWEDEQQLVEDFYMNETELSAMQRTGMLLGSHTVTHPVMSKLDDDAQLREITDSFAFLDRVTGGLPVRTFCYPHGGFHTFTEATERLLTEAGCAFSFNVEARDITNVDVTRRPQALPRYDCNMFPHGKCREHRD